VSSGCVQDYTVDFVVSGFMILIGAAIMSLIFIGALKYTSRQYPLNYIYLALFVSRLFDLISAII